MTHRGNVMTHARVVVAMMPDHRFSSVPDAQTHMPGHECRLSLYYASLSSRSCMPCSKRLSNCLTLSCTTATSCDPSPLSLFFPIVSSSSTSGHLGLFPIPRPPSCSGVGGTERLHHHQLVIGEICRRHPFALVVLRGTTVSIRST